MSDSKVIHWTANPEEFEAVKRACSECSEESSCSFHRTAERRMNANER